MRSRGGDGAGADLELAGKMDERILRRRWRRRRRRRRRRGRSGRRVRFLWLEVAEGEGGEESRCFFWRLAGVCRKEGIGRRGNIRAEITMTPRFYVMLKSFVCGFKDQRAVVRLVHTAALGRALAAELCGHATTKHERPQSTRAVPPTPCAIKGLCYQRLMPSSVMPRWVLSR